MLFNIIKGHRAGMAASLTFAVFGLLLNPANISKLFNLPFNLPKANYTNICIAFSYSSQRKYKRALVSRDLEIIA